MQGGGWEELVRYHPNPLHRHPVGSRRRYARGSTGGAAYVELRNCEDKHKHDMMLFIEFHTIVVRDRVPIDAAHKAFLAIDEYRERIALDIPGADHRGDTMGGWS